MMSSVQSFLRVTLYRNRSAEMALKIETGSQLLFLRQADLIGTNRPDLATEHRTDSYREAV
jgi:hypothetical protein